jgi:hypothetical protein
MQRSISPLPTTRRGLTVLVKTTTVTKVRITLTGEPVAPKTGQLPPGREHWPKFLQDAKLWEDGDGQC